jgi:nucleotide-binding universal stress UspA family protein
MAIKDILVHVGSGTPGAERCQIAVKLAAIDNAHLVGLHVRPTLRMPAAVSPEMGAELARLHAEYTGQVAQAARSSFERAAQLEGLTAEWRDVMGDFLGSVALHARYADLSIIGQTDDDERGLEGEQRLVDSLALTNGGPVLVVPAVGHFPVVGQNVLVAWNGSREAQRAVNDAISILQRAKRVVVLTINPDEGPVSHGDQPGADIGLHLARHGVTATCETVSATDVDVGNLLLSRAADEGIDLLVMGAYGRSQLRELVLGGVTRQVLREMTVPTLMSH